MSLPTLRAILGRDRTAVIAVASGSPAFSFLDYSETRFVCSGLGISKSSSVGSEIAIAGGGQSITLYLLAADLAVASRLPGEYRYMIDVKTGTKWLPVCGTRGVLVAEAAP